MKLPGLGGMAIDWREGTETELEIAPALMNLAYSLDCGQAFRWRPSDEGWWIGVVRGHALRLRREGSRVIGQCFPPMADVDRFLAGYLRLDVDLDAIYRRISNADPWIASAVSAFSGLRVLDQEPEETLLSFVCSAANSVPRISRSMAEISRRYGELIGYVDGEGLFTFPKATSLADASVDVLSRECGLGWRGSSLRGVARELVDRPAGWLDRLRLQTYEEAKARLMGIKGIGAKIADCICLFSLRKDSAVPVDTHIWAIAREIFRCEVTTKTLTPATYQTVANLFAKRYGSYAGWAQQYLYLQRRASQGRVRPLSDATS